MTNVRVTPSCLLCVVAILSLALSACGGGGGGGSSGGVSGRGIEFTLPNIHPLATVAPAAKDTSLHIPDWISRTMEGAEEREVHLYTNIKFSLPIDDNGENGNGNENMTENGNENMTENGDNMVDAAAVEQVVDSPEFRALQMSATQQWNIGATHEGGGEVVNPDYLVFGYWQMRSSSGDRSFISFFDGGENWNVGGGVDTITGTAEYRGPAAGRYITGLQTAPFTASAALTGRFRRPK